MKNKSGSPHLQKGRSLIMADNKDYLVQAQENGNVLISEEVVASIAALAVREIEGVYVGDLLSRCMSRVEEGSLWITIMSNINIVAVASLADVACIILAEGVVPDESVLATALQKGINIYTSDKTAYQLAASLAECLQ